MSDVQTRPAASRGRGAPRGGRGGFSSRGGRNASRAAAASAAATNGDAKHDSDSNALPSPNDEGEVSDLNRQYGDNVAVIKEMFPDWTPIDILYALKETDGNLTVTIERMAEGKLLPVPLFASASNCVFLPVFLLPAPRLKAETDLSDPHHSRYHLTVGRSFQPKEGEVQSKGKGHIHHYDCRRCFLCYACPICYSRWSP